MKKHFTNTLKLLKFTIKKEIVTAAVWFACLIGMSVAVVMVFGIVLSESDLLGMMGTLNNPAVIAMCGPLYGILNPTPAAVYAAEMTLLSILAAGVMNIFFVVRNTRGDEEKGRGEMIRSLPVGKLSNLAATLTAAAIMNILLTLIMGAGVFAAGAASHTSYSFAGAFTYAAMHGVCGLFFACAAAVFSQLASGGGSAVGLSLAFLGLCYILRIPGDMQAGTAAGEIISCILPAGLLLRAQAFVQNNIWPFFIVIPLSLVIAGLAFYLNAARDLGAGMIPDRKGRRTASPLLCSPVGLAFRLLRGPLIGWAVCMLIFGMTFGAIDMSSFLDSNPMIADAIAMQGYSMAEAFQMTLMSVFAIMAAMPAVMAILKLTAEEKNHRIEQVLTKAVSRNRLLAGYLIIALISSVIMMFAIFIGLWGASAAVGEAADFGTSFAGALIYLPALWFMVGLAALLGSVLPEKAAVISWAYLGFSMFIVYIAKLMQLPGWLEYFVPFGYIPKLPAASLWDGLNWLKVLFITFAAAGMSAGAFAVYRRRDLI